MSDLHAFFELNRGVLVFVYGLIFFVLGVATGLQSRQHSRKDFARSLPWLSAFGLAHGLYEWTELLIAVQPDSLSSTRVGWLQIVPLGLLTLSFTCLCEFGVRLLRPQGRARWFYGAGGGLFLGWLLLVFAIVPPWTTDWLTGAKALAHLWMGLPAALVAAFGLLHHTRRWIVPLKAPGIVYALRLASIALALYGVFDGLIGPPVPFFPGNLINTVSFTQTLGFPPEIVRSLIGLVLTVAIIRALEIFKLETERFIGSMELLQVVSAERERLARDLHDGAIQKVYSAGLLIESARKKVPGKAEVTVRMDQALDLLNDAIIGLRRNLGELSALPSRASLPEALGRIASDPRLQSLMDVSLDLDLPAGEALGPRRLEQVLAILNEALANVARHARARSVQIRAVHRDSRFLLSVQDDGVGLPHPFPEAGYGLRNMRDRAHLLQGEVQFTGAPDEGTTVLLDVPWEEGEE